jgi:hypothetical protein
VGAQYGVVGLNNSRGSLGRRIDAEIQLGLLSVINGESLQKKRSESRASSSSDTVEDQESLKSSAVVDQLSDSVQSGIDELFSNGVVTSGVVVGGIFLSRKKLVRVEELSVSSVSGFVDDAGLQIDKDSTGNVLASRSLREEGVEGIILYSWSLVAWHHSVWLNSMLKAVQFPARISELNSSLSNVNRKNLSHDCALVVEIRKEKKRKKARK